MSKFLVINPFGIGDVLFTTPVLRAVKQQDPSNSIAYWCNARVAPLLEGNPHVSRIFALSRGDLKKAFAESGRTGLRELMGLVGGLKKERFDISLDFSLDHRYSLLTALLGVPKRVGFNYKQRGRFLTHPLVLSGYEGAHMVEHYARLLELIGLQAQDKSLELFVSPRERSEAKERLAASGIGDNDTAITIAAGGGASWGKDARLKHWPAGNFAQLADRLSEIPGARIVLLGDSSESRIAEEIMGLMRTKPVDLVGKTTLRELAGLIASSRLLIANDGGPLHIAAALGVRTVSFFGPVDPLVYGPYPADKERHAVLRAEAGCNPCYKEFRYPDCSKQHSCLEMIGVDEAYQAALRSIR